MEKKIVYEDEALRYIAKFCDGGCRDAITLLDKCLSSSNELTLENVLKIIGSESYETFFDFLEELLTKNSECIHIIDDAYRQGKDVKHLMKEFSKFLLDVQRYILNGNFKYISIPETEVMKEKLQSLTQSRTNIMSVIELVLDINNQIKWDSDPKTLIDLNLLIFCNKED